MKKVLSLVLVLTLVLGSFSFAFAAPADVAGTEYEDAVARLEQLKVLEGYPDGTFKPNNTITRAEFAAVVVRAKGLDSAAQAAKGTTVFTDVPSTNWASGYVNIASKMNFVKGMGDGTFAPNSPVTYEQAVTMVIRALGYDVAAEARGGYPYGYLIVANENGLLDAVKGVQGIPAPRGLVAQLVDNALEIPQMIQVGYGTQTKWVVSGTEDTEERLLLDDLGFDKITGRMTERVNDDNEVTLTDSNNKDHVLIVKENFDSEANFGLNLTAWVDGKDNVAVYSVKETPVFDALEWDADDEELTFVAAEKANKVSGKATMYLNGDKVKKASELDGANYAKVVVKDKEVIFVDAYTLNNHFVVNEVDGNVAYDYNDDEVNLKGYTIVKAGKSVAIADLEEGDNLFFNKSIKYAEVYNNSVNGEIERVYSTSFKVDGTTYAWDANALYLEDSELAALTDEVLASMMDEEQPVDIFFNRVGDVVLVVGDTGAPDTSSYYGYVTTTTSGPYNIRNKEYFNLDVLNKEGEVLKYDVAEAYADEFGAANDAAKEDSTYAEWKAAITKGNVVLVTVDEDGVLDSVTDLTRTFEVGKDGDGNVLDAEELKVSAKYAGTNSLPGTALVFWTQGATKTSDIEIMTWAEAADEFSKVTDATFYVNSANKVVAVVVRNSDANVDKLTYTGLVTNVRKFSGTTAKWEITIAVNGESKVFVTDTSKVKVTGDFNGVEKGKFAKLTVGDKSELVEAIALADTVDITVKTLSTSGKTITATVTDDVYRLVDGFKVYDTNNKEIALRDLNDGDKVTLALDKAGSIFVKYVKRTALAPAGGGSEETDKATFEQAFTARGNVWVTIDGTDYLYGGTETLTDLNAYKDKEVEFVTRTVDGETVVVSIKLAE